MIYLWITILIIVNLGCLAFVLINLPGNWFMLAVTFLFAWWQREYMLFSGVTLIGIVILAIIGEILEFFAGMGGAKRAGAGWKGAFGAFLGGICGGILGTFLIPIPIFGTLLGACVGAGIGTGIIEHSKTQQIDHSVKTGMGAGVGVLLGTISKFIIGVVIWLIIAITAYWF